jgi:hypothetical protein
MKILKVRLRRWRWGDNFVVISNELDNGNPFYVNLCDKALHYIVMYIFLPQIYFGITHYKLEKNIFSSEFFCYGLPYYAIFLEKYAPKLPWLKFKHGHP